MPKPSSPQNPDLRRFRNLALAAAIMTYLLIVVGGIVRVTESGLGCPDWPTCFGHWIPPMRIDAILEYTHRLAASLTSPLIVLAAAFSFWRFGKEKWISRPLGAAVVLLIFEVALGGVVVVMETPPNLVAIHMGLALLILAGVLVSVVVAFVQQRRPDVHQLVYQSKFARFTLATVVATFVLLVSGALVAGSGATRACVGWPLCNGRLFPVGGLAWIQWTHRLITLVTGVMVAVLIYRAWRTQRSHTAVLTTASIAGTLFLAQVLVGAFKVTTGFPVYLLALHVATSAAVWASMVVLGVLVGLAARTTEQETLEAQSFSGRTGVGSDLLMLTKPVVVALLLVTTYAGMVIGGRDLPGLSVTFWTLLGGALSAGGASAINQYIDREKDALMQRTQKRPIPAGRLTPGEGLAFGASLCVAAFYSAVFQVNLLAGLLVLAGIIYYVLIYSIYLKYTTVQNIVIGGGAGAIPPLVGWAAVTGSLNIPSLFLFAVVFLWTPPHFWALALVRKQDYARAGVPMMPVIRGEEETRRQMFVYTVELVVLTLLLPLFGLGGSIYLIGAILLGLWLLSAAWRVWKQGGNKLAWKMYRYSSMYLAFLFLAMMVDAVV